MSNTDSCFFLQEVLFIEVAFRSKDGQTVHNPIWIMKKIQGEDKYAEDRLQLQRSNNKLG